MRVRRGCAPRALVLVMVLMSGVVAGARAQSAADSVRALDAAWARAYATHDTALALALFADSLVVTSADGSVKDKSREMADIRPVAGLVMHFFRTSGVDVRVYPGAAIVIGIAEWSFTYNGRASEIRRRYTSVFVPGGTLGWRMVALHLGRAPEP